MKCSSKCKVLTVGEGFHSSQCGSERGLDNIGCEIERGIRIALRVFAEGPPGSP